MAGQRRALANARTYFPVVSVRVVKQLIRRYTAKKRLARKARQRARAAR